MFTRLISFILLMILASAAYAQEKKLTLGDLGIGNEEIMGDPKLQKQLEVRSSMLGKHQTWGLITQGIMTAALLTGGMAKGDSNEFHQYLGMATFATYWTSAYYAIYAPKPDSVKDQGQNIKWHKNLA